MRQTVMLYTYGREPHTPRAQRLPHFDLTVDAEIGRHYTEDGRRSRLDDTLTHRCSGQNGRILMVMVLTPGVQDCIYEAKRAVLQWNGLLPRLQQAFLNIGVRCRRGRHRSQAVAVMLGHCLARDGFDVETVHIDRTTCGCPGVACLNLRQHPTAEREELASVWHADGIAALEVCYRMWCAL